MTHRRVSRRGSKPRSLRLERLEGRQLLAVSQPAGIIWDPSPNYNGRGGTDVDAIVIHTTEGSYSGALSWMKNPDSDVSAHFIISPGGEIRQLVANSNRAWHATYYNSRSIGIEMAGWAGDPATWNSTNLGRLEHLVAWLADQFDVPVVRPGGNAYDYPNDQYNAAGIVAHAQIQPWNRSDPGPHFPWTSFVQNVGSYFTTPPVAHNDTFTTAEDTPLVANVVANDTDAENDPLSAELVQAPTHGQVTASANGSFTYTPAVNYVGADSFTYRVNDGFADGNVATVTITVTPVNDAPDPVGDVYVLDEDTTLSVSNAWSSETPWIAPGAVWKFLDNGSDQGTAWRSRFFDDGAWASGPAQLGYGEGDEATTVGYGSNAADKHKTTYFRHAFDVQNADQYAFAVLRMLRDDGAAAYINGVEIVRDGLSAGATYDDLATVAGDDGQTWQTYHVPLSMLADGTNVLAVEVHQATLDSTDLTFAAELWAYRPQGILGNDTDAETGLDPNQPTRGMSVSLVRGPRHGTLDLSPTGSFTYQPDPDFSGVDAFVYRASDGTAESRPASVTLIVKPRDDLPASGIETYTAVPGQPLSINAAEVQTVDLVPAGALWRYLADGSNQGTAWRELAFVDGAWAQGAGELGYGDDDEFSFVPYGPSAAQKYVTTYFRHSFYVANPAFIQSLALRLVRDDGAAVYLNGVEIARTPNLAPGASFDALADFGGAAAISAADEATFLEFNNIDPALLRDGENVLAVEMHQHRRDSTDLSFDARLVATRRRAGLLLNDTDGDGASLSAIRCGDPDHGSLSLSAAGAFIYFPQDGFVGDDEFCYMARDTRSVLLAAGSVWKYYDRGAPVGGEAWRAHEYDDALWASGPAQFGYGEGDEATPIASGSNPNQKRITTYFRREFFVPETDNVQSVTLRLLRDDGAAVFINGVETVRDGLPAGATHDTLAANATDDGQTFKSFSIAPALLRAGMNHIAVEVHQSSATSTDLSFDLELTASISGGPVFVQVTVPPEPGDANGDGRADLADLAILAGNFGMASGATWREGDFDDSGSVSIEDVRILRNLLAAPGSAPAAVVAQRRREAPLAKRSLLDAPTRPSLVARARRAATSRVLPTAVDAAMTGLSIGF